MVIHWDFEPDVFVPIKILSYPLTPTGIGQAQTMFKMLIPNNDVYCSQFIKQCFEQGEFQVMNNYGLSKFIEIVSDVA